MSFVEYERKGKIAFITLNRPAKLNAMTPQMYQDLGQRFEQFDEDQEAWAAVVSGNGRAFCAGSDIGAPDSQSQEEYRRYRQLIPPHSVMDPILRGVWKPIIGAHQGYVLGGGFLIALHCDLRITSADTMWGIPELKRGWPTEMMAHLCRVVGMGNALELALVGKFVSAQRAYEMHLVNKVVPTREELLPEAVRWAEEICECAPVATRLQKEGIYMAGAMPVLEGRLAERAIYAKAFETEDRIEGRLAWQQRRKPVWKGK